VVIKIFKVILLSFIILVVVSMQPVPKGEVDAEAITIEIEEDLVEEIEEPFEPQTYICDLWREECNMALAIAMAESNINCNALGINYNGSADFSVFQINSAHIKRFGLETIASCKSNIDTAYTLWKESGWGIWSAYNNGRYKMFL